MSLKSFHILLISLSSLLALLFGGWSVRAYTVTGEMQNLVFGVASFVAAAMLVVYIVWFARKIRSRDEEDRERRKMIRPLALGALTWMLSGRTADACSVCYGAADGPMIDAARMGVWALFGLVFAVQVCFVAFFFVLRRRAREHGARRSD